MGMDWYDMIAKRNGGYKSNAIYTIEGESGEEEFEKRLIEMLPSYESVLDAGCGDGEFTLKMAKYAKKIIGFDNSNELLKIASLSLQEINEINNVKFIYAHTKDKDGLPFEDEQFDLIYNRRGPTSIYNYIRILRSGGRIFSIHPACLEKAKERLIKGGFINIKIEIFDKAYIYFPNEIEYAKWLTAIPGNPDYTIEENKDKLEKKIKENIIDGRIGEQLWRYLVTATKA
ncbi:methyltransferase family protein [Orenia metallireducens]|jgi:SAM-dependent methyltransferase|uniref:Methyltransferase domain-containing protein n=1 Tax=Orenia metallireducens TaxID=1413210 RepID=A0A285HW32_9FIRM|nr:methyltransferase domain-containing protein [Orenia metallireducens]PRX29326.1 methyltransferase family protein [Orenia metallireducens]SNY39894.1 Methyltransferase domain-containing protein [Orenia metallireducens]